MDELRAEIKALEERMPRPYNKNPELNKERTKLLAKLRRMVAKAAEADDPGTDEDEINMNDPMFKGMTEKEIEAEWESFSEKGGFRGTVESQIHESYPKMKKGHPLFKAIQPEKEPTSAETTSPGKEPTSPEKEPTSAGKKTTAPTVSPQTNVITPRRKKKFRGSPLEGASRTPQRPISAEKKKEIDDAKKGSSPAPIIGSFFTPSPKAKPTTEPPPTPVPMPTPKPHQPLSIGDFGSTGTADVSSSSTSHPNKAAIDKRNEDTRKQITALLHAEQAKRKKEHSKSKEPPQKRPQSQGRRGIHGFGPVDDGTSSASSSYNIGSGGTVTVTEQKEQERMPPPQRGRSRTVKDLSQTDTRMGSVKRIDAENTTMLGKNTVNRARSLAQLSAGRRAGVALSFGQKKRQNRGPRGLIDGGGGGGGGGPPGGGPPGGGPPGGGGGGGPHGGGGDVPALKWNEDGTEVVEAGPSDASKYALQRNAKLPPGEKPPTQETMVTHGGKEGDAYLNNPTHANTTASLRPTFAMAGHDQVLASDTAQAISDIRYDMFDIVRPGFGQGEKNKLFLQQQYHEDTIRFRAPMHNGPGSYIGPLNLPFVPPWQLQPIMTREKMDSFIDHKMNELRQTVVAIANQGVASTGVLGTDVGYPFDVSSSGLRRDKDSPFEPVIRNDINWIHQKQPAGYQLNQKMFRYGTDAQRYPRDLDTNTNGVGGPHLPKYRSLEVILP